MRRVVLPYEGSTRRSAQSAIQSSSLPLIPLNQEGSLVQSAKTALERPELERTHILVAELENEVAIAESEIASLSTPMP